MSNPDNDHAPKDETDPPRTIAAGRHDPMEIPWLSRYQFLHDCGYELRPRYRPGWIAPWEPYAKDYQKYEESFTPRVSRRCAAIFVSTAD